jgi:hypothetical protein
VSFIRLFCVQKVINKTAIRLNKTKSKKNYQKKFQTEIEILYRTKTDTGEYVEYTKALRITMLKELGKIAL